MIIGFPLTEEATGISTLLSDARAFFIYNTATKKGDSVLIEDLLENHNTQSLLEALILEKVTALTCQEIFALGYKAAKEMGIEVFRTETPDIEKTIGLFENGDLIPFSFDSAKTNGCSANCTSCGDSQCKTG